MTEIIKKIILEAAGETNFDILKPPENFGDYSSNIALKLAKIRKENPLEIAKTLKKEILSRAPKDFFERIEIALPGFLNFWLSAKTVKKEFLKILKEKGDYGRPLQKKEKIQLEFISANPTGPLTLANGRGGFLGDALARILEFEGCEIEREYYINDTGNQILTLGKSALAVLKLIPKEENFYQGRYLQDWTRQNTDFIKKNKDNPLKIGQKAAQSFIKSIKAVLKKANIKFDRFTSENKEIREKNFIDEVIKIFERENLTYKKDGALWLKTINFGDDKDRVLITQDNFPTYFLTDAAHYLETKKRGFKKKINILGPDHFGYVKRIQAASQIIGLKSETLITQAVRLRKKGKEVKMSKRKGEFITFEKLIEEVGLDVARFFFLITTFNTHLDFDLDLAKKKSLKNPVYYLQYAYVRAKNIIKKSPVKLNVKKINFELLSETDLILIKKLIGFPDIISKVSETYEINQLASFGLELAAAFHNFYEKEKVIGEKADLSQARLALVSAYLNILEKIFEILGISKPKKM